MASIDTEKAAPSPLETEAPPPKGPPSAKYSSVDVVLRILLLATTVVAVVVMVTGNEIKVVPVQGSPLPVPLPAKFQHSPALIYFVAAFSVVGLYSIIALLGSLFVLSKPGCRTTAFLYLAIIDVLILGLAASATGTAGGVAYVGLKGNSHVGWNKVCNVYDKFCRHVGSSVALGLVASALLVLLICLSIFTLHCRIRT